MKLICSLLFAFECDAEVHISFCKWFLSFCVSYVKLCFCGIWYFKACFYHTVLYGRICLWHAYGITLLLQRKVIGVTNLGLYSLKLNIIWLQMACIDKTPYWFLADNERWMAIPQFIQMRWLIKQDQFVNVMN